MRWEALEQWGDDVVRLERLTGGVANEVFLVRLGDEMAVGRLGSRSDDDLAWEAELMAYLDREGLCVPLPIPTVDGRLFIDGLMVMTYVDGVPPSTDDDWRRAAVELRRLHEVTAGWRQRPGWRSSADLLEADTGTKVDLAAMPPEAVDRCRAAWRPLSERDQCVIHGDANNVGNVLVTAERIGFVDWDEAHVDVPALDLVLPANAANLDEAEYDLASQASAAWEAAVCWDDDYARDRLAEVRSV